jgi:hypothetical protein
LASQNKACYRGSTYTSCRHNDAKKEDEVAARRSEIERQQQEIKQQNEQLEAQNKATMLGVQALLRDRLIQAFNYYLARGWIEAGERDNIDNMYTQYEALGPNNVISDIYNQVRTLPSIPPESHPVSAHAVAQ